MVEELQGLTSGIKKNKLARKSAEQRNFTGRSYRSGELQAEENHEKLWSQR